MKILHLGKYYPPYFGGIEKVNFDLVESINESGYNADVLCFNHKPGFSIEDNGNKVYRTSTITSAFSSPLSISVFKQIRKIYHQYDIIHLHVPNPMGAVALQSVPFKGKIIVHWHSDIIKQKLLKKFYKPFQNKLLQRADKIIVTSPNYLEGSEDLKPYKEKCTIIPIGISNSEFITDEKFRYKLRHQYKNKKVIFSMGRLIYYKGFEYLIDAAKELPEDFIILIGGTGLLKNKLQEQIAKYKLENKVFLLGRIPFEQLGEYYRRADIYCLSSTERSEAFGVVLIEAMSFGCPIVSTNISGSGAPWVNQNNKTGIVVEPKSSHALAKAIIEITNDSEKKDKFSKNALERYCSIFEKHKMAEKTIELYNSLLQA
jgi:rhamnosyl/mannosyltransferase